MRSGLIVEWAGHHRRVVVERLPNGAGVLIGLEDRQTYASVTLTEAQYTDLAAAMFGGADITALQRAEASDRILGLV